MNRRDEDKELLSILGNLIDSDLGFIFSDQTRTKNKATAGRNEKWLADANLTDGARRIREQFAGYLATVVSQPIGLRASVSPFNESPESMLAYLMDVFRLEAGQLEEMLLGSALDRFKSDKKNNSNRGLRPNWRPKLRLHISPPALQSDRIGDLILRAYLFSEQEHELKTRRAQDNSIRESKSILDLIRRSRSKSNMTTPLRFADELLGEIKFVKNSDETYRLEPASNTDRPRRDRANNQGSELQIGVRRDQCEHLKSPQILGLEFWLRESKVLGLRDMKRLLESVSSSCCRPRDNSSPSPYVTDGKLFYGFTHIKLHQIPAYAIRINYPIQSLLEKPIDNCEICLEFINGDISRQPSIASATSQSIINHVRLYALCMAYQLAVLSARTDISLDGVVSKRIKTIPNLDNLLFLPAFSMINQHRLQNNLSQLEDQSLRRVAVLMLLLCLEKRCNTKIVPILHRLLLMSIAEHEYLNAHRQFNNTTRQEVEIFQRDVTIDRSRDAFKMLEGDVIQAFTNDLLSPSRIKNWLTKIDSTSIDHKKLDVLAALRLVKTALVHNEINPMVDFRLKTRSMAIKDQVNGLLASAIFEELSVRLNCIISKNVSSAQKTRTKRRGLKYVNRVATESIQSAQLNPWQKLFCDIQSLENDIILHWSERGLDCLALQQTPTNTNNLMSDASVKKLRVIIQNKISAYLASKS